MSADVSADVVRRHRRAVSALFFCQGFAFAALITRIPAIQEKFGLSDGQLAGLLALVPIVAGVGSVVAGNLAVRFHSAVVLRICGIGVSLSIVIVGAATDAGSLPLLLLGLVFLGFGLGSVDATMNMQGIGVQALAGRSIMASFHAWWSLATILGAVGASIAAATSLSLFGFMVIVAVILIPIQLVAGPRLVRSRVADHAGPDPLAASSAVPWRPLLVFGAAVVGAFVIDSSVSNWSAVDLVSVQGATESVAALAYAAYAVAMLSGRLVTDRLVVSRGPTPVIWVGSIVAAVGLVGVALAPGEGFAIASFAVVGLGLSPVLPLAFTAAARHDPQHTGIAVARVNVGNYIGFVLGAPLVGVIAEFSSLRVGFGILAFVALAIGATAKSFSR
ncbi:MAG: MFS transporter [Candidatus Nanopelagicales bacterium]